MTAPRVFISYSREDGEDFATALRQRLENEEPEITLWQDRAKMQGGVGWWSQITTALDAVSYLVLIVTERALRSDVIEKEWRYARQQGVCVCPVVGAPDKKLDFAAMPRWMRDAHFYDLDREWQTFVLFLKSPCNAPRVPFMAPDLPANFVDRGKEFGPLLQHLVEPGRAEPIPTTLALHGPGGFGKTTLAARLCHHEDIITGYADGILWATLGERPNVLAELTKLYAALTRERPRFVNEEDAALTLADRIEDRRLLLVIDDVWDSSHLEPFLRGGVGCARLITTRSFEVAMMAKQRIPVEEMAEEEAASLLASAIAHEQPSDRAAIAAMAHRLGRWPLLLELGRSTLGLRLARGDTPQGALTYLAEAFNNKGVVAFDHRNPQQRNQAAERTITVSLDLLGDDERRQYRALAIFPGDADVPLGAMAILLELSKFETERVAGVFADLSLLKLDLAAGTLQLHDVMRTYLARGLPDATMLHARLADTWSAPDKLVDDYAWRYAAYHSAGAIPSASGPEQHRRIKRLVDLVTDPRFQAGHSRELLDPPALRADLRTALCRAAEDRDPEALILVLRSVRALAGFREPNTTTMFEYAREGRIHQARRFLLLFAPGLLHEAGKALRQAAILTLAWEAAAAGYHIEASALIASEQEGMQDLMLQTLLQRVRSVIDPRVPLPPCHLPPAPDPSTVSWILQRSTGASFASMAFEPQLLSDAAGVYLAETDGPLLVAFAADASEEKTRIIRRYIAANASNSFSYYGRRSLSALIRAVVQHPDPEWTLDILKQLMAGVLSRAQTHFVEGLPLTIQALKAWAGDRDALATLEDRTQQSVVEVQNLSPERGEGDPWAHPLRRLVILAEIHHYILGQPGKAQQLLEEAVSLGFDRNFAGFRAPACLTLAEGLRVCGQDSAPAIEGALDAALAAAHNVQDPQFCARATAQVNAMRIRWWPAAPGGIDPAQTIERLIRDPLAPEFQPLHTVGEKYHHRVDLPTSMPLPDWLQQATALHDILACYDINGEAAVDVVVKLNPKLPPHAGQVLPVGQHVSIPDPGFAPLLAARLAAEVLRAEELPRRERAWLIQRLAPVAQSNLTALDTVAARLLMAAMPGDALTMASLAASLV
jgi:hypothetical protein